MILTLLKSQPAIALVWVLAIVLSLTVHEFSHALVGKWRGDATAERMGRLTLNPLAHVDWMGFIAVLLLGFGWAKPVPYNPYNLKNPKWDSVWIALAGPASNLIFAIVSALVLRGVLIANPGASLSLLSVFLIFMVILNLFLLLFNIIPVHPLDGSKLLFALMDSAKYAHARNFIATRGPQMLLVLVLISIFTSYNVFFFVSEPAFAICDTLTGGSCLGLMSMIFSL